MSRADNDITKIDMNEASIVLDNESPGASIVPHKRSFNRISQLDNNEM